MAGFRWFQVVSWWFQVVSFGFRWLQMVSGGFRWFKVVPRFSKYKISFVKKNMENCYKSKISYENSEIEKTKFYFGTLY